MSIALAFVGGVASLGMESLERLVFDLAKIRKDGRIIKISNGSGVSLSLMNEKIARVLVEWKSVYSAFKHLKDASSLFSSVTKPNSCVLDDFSKILALLKAVQSGVAAIIDVFDQETRDSHQKLGTATNFSDSRSCDD